MSRQTAINIPKEEPKRRSLSKTVFDVLGKYGPKRSVLARQLECSEAHLSEVMSGKKHWPDDWLDYIAEHYDFECEIAQHFAELRGLVVREPRAMSAKEWKRRVSYKLRSLNGVGKALLEDAMALPDDIFADDEEADS